VGTVEAPCERLAFRYDAGRDLLLVAGDVDRGATLHAWAPVGVYDMAGHGRGAMHLRDLRSTLAPPLPWIVEAALGVAAALAVLAVVLLATPLATAAYARLVPLP
jgi:hypothetical protein